MEQSEDGGASVEKKLDARTQVKEATDLAWEGLRRVGERRGNPEWEPTPINTAQELIGDVDRFGAAYHYRLSPDAHQRLREIFTARLALEGLMYRGQNYAGRLFAHAIGNQAVRVDGLASFGHDLSDADLVMLTAEDFENAARAIDAERHRPD
jgi:hypothetical protein